MDIQEVRIRNLKEFVYLRGGAAAMSRMYDGINTSYISQLVNGMRSFGEKAARKLEMQCGLPKNYFDQPINIIESNDIKNVEPRWMERLAKVINDRDCSITKISEQLNIPTDKVKTLVSGSLESWNENELMRVCNYLDISPSWVFFNKLPGQSDKHSFEVSILDNPDYPAIKRVSLRLSAGIVGYAIEYDIEDKTPIVMQKEWFASRGFKPSNLLAIKVKGESMQPGLYDGDTVVINTADRTPSDGDVFAINYEGEMLIKRMIRDHGTWWLSSDNPDQRKFPRKECTSELCILIGKVVHKQSEVI